jgi:type I restriction enzyme S subunit
MKQAPILFFGEQISLFEHCLAVMGRGATNQTELSRDTIASLPFLNPPQEITMQFEIIKDEIAYQMQNLIRQNVALTKARDLLLPRLMNGDIVV